MPEAAPAANPNQAPKTPPMGNAAAAQPTPNRGYEAAGLQRLGLIMQQLSEIAPMLGVGHEAYNGIQDFIKKVSKFVPPGSVTPAAQNQMIQRLSQSQQQNNQQMQALAQQRAAGQGGQPQQQQPAAA